MKINKRRYRRCRRMKRITRKERETDNRAYVRKKETTWQGESKSKANNERENRDDGQK
jgi:hypothetical protein